MFNSCEYGDDHFDVLLPISEVRNHYGIFFLKQLQNQAGAYEQFATMLSSGQEPLYEYVQMMSNADYGVYYFIPYGKENKVEGAIYYPFKTAVKDRVYIDTPLGTPIKMDAYHLNNDVDVAKRFLYSIPFKELKNKHLEVNPALVEFADKLENKYVMLLPEESSSLQEVATRNSYKEVVAFNIEYQLESFSTIEGNEIVVSALSPDRVYQTMKYVLAQHNIRLYEFGGIEYGRICFSILMSQTGNSPGDFMKHFTEEVRREISFLGYDISFQYLFHIYYIPVGGDGGSTGGGSSGTGGTSGTGSGSSEDIVAPLAKKIFRNSNMTEQNWVVLERMIEKIRMNCMGNALYNELKEVLGGKTLSIQFIDSGNSSFSLDGGIRLNINVVSGDFLHEMLHAYQAYNESFESMMGAKLNMEIETHYAQYLYQSSLPEYQVKNNKWKKRDTVNARWTEIVRLNMFLDGKGNLLPGISNSKLENVLLNRVIPTLQANGYPLNRYSIDYDRIGSISFKNIKVLTTNC